MLGAASKPVVRAGERSGTACVWAKTVGIAAETIAAEATATTKKFLAPACTKLLMIIASRLGEQKYRAGVAIASAVRFARRCPQSWDVAIMLDANRIGSSSRARTDKFLPLAILAAAGIGYFVLSRGNDRTAADRDAAPARAARTGSRKICTAEPMAGYGR
jgi:hypothetical protein